MKLNKSLVMGLTTLALSPVASVLGSGICTTQVVHAATVASTRKNGIETKTFTNKEIFDHLEAHGYDVKAMLGEREYQADLRQDSVTLSSRTSQSDHGLLGHGGTYIKTNKHGFTIYINSAIAKVLVVSGSVGAGAALAWLLGSIGLGGAALARAESTIVGVAIAAGSKAMSRGFYVKCSNKGKMVSWGYQ